MLNIKFPYESHDVFEAAMEEKHGLDANDHPPDEFDLWEDEHVRLVVLLASVEMLKGIFLEVKKKFETAIGVLRQEKITIDPEDPTAVDQYAKVMKTVRQKRHTKADLFSESQRIQFTIKQHTDGIQDARSYLLALKDIRLKRGLTDELGTEAMMMDALEKVEKDIKKPLTRNEKKGTALLTGEFNKINQNYCAAASSSVQLLTEPGVDVPEYADITKRLQIAAIYIPLSGWLLSYHLEYLDWILQFRLYCNE
ncbi:probable ATP synthase 24 kDa subunit, mitochondrial [Tanacetum coccineum]